MEIPNALQTGAAPDFSPKNLPPWRAARFGRGEAQGHSGVDWSKMHPNDAQRMAQINRILA
jgi:hypothetical protein